jgi:hypothetical protein
MPPTTALRAGVEQLKRERTGPSPEKEATHHTVKPSATDSMIDAGTAVARGVTAGPIR